MQTQINTFEGMPCLTRHSRRAKHLQMRVRPDANSNPVIEIILPVKLRQGYDPTHFLQEKRSWLRRQKAKLMELSAKRSSPTEIDLVLANKRFNLHFQHHDTSVSLVELPDDSLLLTADECSPAELYPMLQSWLLKQAKCYLPQYLADLSACYALPYHSVTVRYQRTRWGSCSAQKRISLNARLLLLAPELAEYVILHELCHTREMNHGPKFWQLLTSFLPDAKNRQRALADAASALPRWACML